MRPRVRPALHLEIPEPPASLARIAHSAGREVETLIRLGQDEILRDLQSAFGNQGAGPAGRLDRRLRTIDPHGPTDLARRAAIAGLALGLPARPAAHLMPPSVEAMRSRAMKTLARYLCDAPVYASDCYAKDARFVAGMTAPAGAQIVDIAFRQGLGGGIRRLIWLVAMAGRAAASGDLGGAAKLLRGAGWRPWLEIHTDERALEDFNEAGWDACYRRVADILAANPKLAGVYGASWFYDPQLPAISPRLAYLQDRPIERGAVMVRLSGGAIHTRRAAQTSPTRAALIASDRYRPVCYALFWPRRELLAWAEACGRPR